MSSETGVYCILNRINGKVYVGSSSKQSITKRWTGHRKALNAGTHSNRHLQSAWNKYGPLSFEWKVLVECPPEDCLVWEQNYIDLHKSADQTNGYNISPTAGSNIGVKHTEEVKAANSERAKKQFSDPEARKRVSERKTGVKMSEEHCAKQRARKHTEETKKLMSVRRSGRKNTKEHNAKIAFARKMKPMSFLALVAAARRRKRAAP